VRKLGEVWPVRRWILKDRTCALALRKASFLIAGRNDVKLQPFLPRALRARKVKPRKVNDVCSKEARRLPSLQYTIRVLVGCRRSPTSASLSAIAVASMRAWRSLTQCTTASST
jgi:hypothetical protein